MPEEKLARVLPWPFDASSRARPESLDPGLLPSISRRSDTEIETLVKENHHYAIVHHNVEPAGITETAGRG